MLRQLFKSDLPAVLEIEESVHIVPWTEDTFKTCFKEGYYGWVAESGDKVVGFVVISMHSQDCHVLNLAVGRPYQHHGWGRQLLQHALKYAASNGVHIAYLEVRRSNSRAISLYQQMKFQQVGERKDYYPSGLGHEDALIFAKSLLAGQLSES